MEGNDSGLTSYFHHHHQHQHHHSGAVAPGANGMFGSAHNNATTSSSAHYSSEATPLVFPPHSVTGRAPVAAPPESMTVRRKRGRPRKYGAAEASGASASSAKRVSASPSVSLSPSSHKKEPSLLSSGKKAQMVALGQTYDGSSIEKWLKAENLTCPVTMQKLQDPSFVPHQTLKHLINQWLCKPNHNNNNNKSFDLDHYFRMIDPDLFLASLNTPLNFMNPVSKQSRKTSTRSQHCLRLSGRGNAGQGFVPHVITVAAGEDVAQKIMSFMQQRKRAVCIMSASGSISNASLRQPASLGGNVTYEGRFEIVSLSGSFLHTDIGGASSSRTGGLSICLSGSDGRIVGGGVGGPLKAAGPVQVIAGSFVMDTKKEVTIDPNFETSGSNVPHVIRATVSTVGFHSPQDSSGTSIRGNDDQCVSGNNFILPPRGMHDWRGGLESSSAFPGRTDHGGCPSPDDGDNDHLHD